MRNIVLSLLTLVTIALIAFSSVSGQQTTNSETATIEGVVLDATGKPIPEAAVYALSIRDIRHRLITTTDAQGRFSIQHVPPEAFWVHAYKESAGYPDSFFSFYALPDRQNAAQTVKITAENSHPKITLDLGKPYATLRIRLEDETGRQVNGGASFDRPDHPYFSTHELGASVPESGVMLVPPVPFRLTLSLDDYEDWHYTAGTGRAQTDLISLSSGETLAITVRMKKRKP